ncbi:M3 family metallopeptidase [Maricaulis sp.]|uniref:M3 family metallopeptidase n=1 Tax=Maricaulis sp. TaxID=1486257 RepID=UPI001B1CB91A|nr:M3 family metallopeptidase [Maricaulis sp.]MBO6797872.1 M3 family metallopeptidase [Maricaulis sp.]
MASVASLALLTACGQVNTGTDAETSANADASSEVAADVNVASNPFLEDGWDTPFGTPPFDRIENEHFAPAFDAGIAESRAEFAAIVENADAPTYENTIIAMERLGSSLSRVQSVFFALASAHTNETIQTLSREYSSQFSALGNDISLDGRLWERINTLYETRDSLGLDADQMRVLELYHRDFVRAGALLNDAAKERLAELNTQISGLTVAYGQNLLAENNGYELVITDEADLAGLPDGIRAAGAREAARRGYENSWVFTTSRSSITPFLTFAENRELREDIYNGYVMRGFAGGDSDNQEEAIEIARLRAERAELLGYANHASYQLETRMAQNPDNLSDFLNQIWEPALARAREERDDMQAMIDAEGGDFQLAAWDWWYYSEKVRQARYSLNEEEVRQYFVLENVRNAAFEVANRLWGLTFHPVEDAQVFIDGVEVWEVREADGTHVGVFYGDFFARPTKRGGAWMNSFRGQQNIDGENQRPVVGNYLNLSPPAEGDPALMSFNEVSTLFHEFGHALHGLLSEQRYPRISGVTGPRDYTEFPAQIYEHWAAAPEVMREFFTHAETGETIPDELMERLQAAATFNQGFATTEYMAASLLDLAWHSLSPEEIPEDALEFETRVLDDIGMMEEIAPRYRSTYFSHIFAGGYSAGYYAYIWSNLLDADGFIPFRENGLYDETYAQRLRENVYGAGGIRPALDLYVSFRGQEPTIEPLLEGRGLIESESE